MRILLVITGLTMGGAERQVCSLADKFHELGHQVKILVLNDNIVIRPTYEDIDIISLKMKKNIFGFLCGYFNARRLVKKYKADIIHGHMFHANIFIRLLRISIFVPKLITTAHSTTEGGRFRQLIYRVTDCLSDISTNVSQEAVNSFLEQGAIPSIDRMIVVENGIDTHKFRYNSCVRTEIRSSLDINDEKSLFISVGRLTEAKDYPNLLYAFSNLLKNSDCNPVLIIIGIGELETELFELVSKLDLQNSVKFLGLKNNIEEWLSACDVYVMSSQWEGLPLTLIEAMACEKYIVATDCGGNRKLVEGYGSIVPIKDSNLLSNALLQSLCLPVEDKKKLGALARSKIVQQYSLASIAKQWLSLYKN